MPVEALPVLCLQQPTTAARGWYCMDPMHMQAVPVLSPGCRRRVQGAWKEACRCCVWCAAARPWTTAETSGDTGGGIACDWRGLQGVVMENPGLSWNAQLDFPGKSGPSCPASSAPPPGARCNAPVWTAASQSRATPEHVHPLPTCASAKPSVSSPQLARPVMMAPSLVMRLRRADSPSSASGLFPGL